MSRKIMYAEDVDMRLASRALHLCLGTYDLAEKFNTQCALHSINLFMEESEDHPSAWFISNHDYTHANAKIQRVIEHVRQTLLDPELPDYVSVGAYLEVLTHICDTYNYNGFELFRDLVSYVNEKARKAAEDQWNSGMHAYSRLNKFIRTMQEDHDVASLEKLLAGVLRLCVGYDKITLDKAYQDACMALTGKPHLEKEN